MFKSWVMLSRKPPKPIALSRLQLAFLNCFDVASPLEGNGGDGAWTRLLGSSAEALSQQFIAAGLIEKAPPAIQVACSMGSVALKAELKKLGLKTSGLKPELAERLALAPGAPVIAARFWTCTTAGRSLTQQYLDREEAERIEAKNRACAASDAGDLERAAQIGGAWDAGRVFPSGLGMDGMDGVARGGRILARLRQARKAIDTPPKALAGLDRQARESLVKAFMRAAVMTEDPSRSSEVADLNLSSEMRPREAVELLAGWVEGQRQLDGWRSAPFVIGITILSPDDCPHALEFKSGRYSLDTCPELPMPDCARKKYGCGCIYSDLPEP